MFRKPFLRGLGCPEGVGSARTFRRRSLTAARVAANTTSVHTPIMTLKNAALLALIGTIMMTALLVWKFVFTFLNVLRGVEAPVLLFSLLIYAFGSLTVTVFFFVFHRAQQ